MIKNRGDERRWHTKLCIEHIDHKTSAKSLVKK